MPIYSLKSYKKKNEASLVTKSITITQEQEKFIDKMNINFSKLIRDFLNDIMQKEKGPKNEN